MPVDEWTPAVKGPPLSCDCHMHVFGDPQTYPYSAPAEFAAFRTAEEVKCARVINEANIRAK